MDKDTSKDVKQTKKEPAMLGTKLIASKEEKRADLNITLSYVAVLILLSLILLPPLLRIFLPIEDDNKKKTDNKTTYITRTCKKTTYKDDYSLVRTVVDKYKDDIIQNSNMTFAIYKNAEIVVDIEELFSTDVEPFRDHDLISYVVEDGSIKISLDYVKNQELKNKSSIADYVKLAGAQKTFYQNKGYVCEDLVNKE